MATLIARIAVVAVFYSCCFVLGAEAGLWGMLGSVCFGAGVLWCRLEGEGNR